MDTIKIHSNNFIEIDTSRKAGELTTAEAQKIVDLLYNYYLEADGLTIGEILQNFIEWLNGYEEAEQREKLQELSTLNDAEFEACISYLY